MDAKQREEKSRQLAEDMQRFLASGGTVRQCRPGESAIQITETHKEHAERIYRNTVAIKKETNHKEEAIKAEMIGKTFGQLTVLSYAGHDNQGSRIWNAKCSCGEMTISTTSKLKMGIKARCKTCGYKASGDSVRKAHEKKRKEKT